MEIEEYDNWINIGKILIDYYLSRILGEPKPEKAIDFDNLPKVPKTTVVKETVEVESDDVIVIEYEGRTYKKFIPCRYKCGMFASWSEEYKQGDRKLHINPLTKEVIGTVCPVYSK